MGNIGNQTVTNLVVFQIAVRNSITPISEMRPRSFLYLGRLRKWTTMYDACLSPQTIYLRLLAGESVPIWVELLCLVLTWALTAVLSGMFARRRALAGLIKT